MNAHIFSILSLSVVTVNCRISCDIELHSSGCEDSLGSFCNQTTNQCQCKDDYTVELGDKFCLKPSKLNESCYVTDQCVNNSKCFYNYTQLLPSNITFWIRPDVPLFPEGECLCPQTHYINEINVCEPKKSIGESCSQDEHCIQPNSVCNATNQKCDCNQTFVYSTIIGHCVQGKYLLQGCTGRQECQYSEPNSWCIDGICLCGAGYTPEPSFNGMHQCVIDTLLVESVDPHKISENVEPKFNYVIFFLIIMFFITILIAVLIVGRNRNSIIGLFRPLNRAQCDQSHVVMIPIDNSINSISDRDNCKLNPQTY